MGTSIKVAKVSDLKPGGSMVVSAQNQEIALFNVGGKFYALENTCPHQGGPLGEGELSGTTVTCPWHAWEFDVTCGKGTENAEAIVSCFPCKVQGEDVFVEIP